MREVWGRLAAASGNLFATPEWVEAWCRHRGRGSQLQLRRVCDPDGQTLAVVPLVLWRTRGVRLLRFAGHGPADELGPACEPAHRGAALAALVEELRRQGGWDLLLAEGLPRQVDPAGLGGVSVAVDASPVVELPPGGWEAFLAGRSRNFRQQARRKERRLLDEHQVTYRLSDDPAGLDADLDVLFDLHDRRWGGPGSGFTGRNRELHRDFAHQALERGWLRLWLLAVGGRPVAAWYGFRYAGVEWFYQSGRDPAWDEWAVGTVLLNHTIRAAAEDGVSAYRMLRGAEAYKEHYATCDPGLRTVALARTPVGRLAVAAARTSARSPALRDWLRRARDGVRR